MKNDIDESLKIVEEAQKKLENQKKNEELENIVNEKEKQLQNDASAQERRKSIRREAIRKRQKMAKRKFAVTFVAGALVGALATVGIIEPLYKDFVRGYKKNSADKELKRQAEIVLLEQGLAERNEDGDIIIKDNDINDYRCLDLTHASSLEQHIYLEVLGKEGDEAIQTASYNNGGYYYTGIEQYRYINGYINSETGKTSLSEQNAAMEDKLVEAYDNNCTGIIRTSEELHESRTKGGK